MMVKSFSMHRPNEGDVIAAGSNTGEHRGKFQPAASISSERIRTSEETSRVLLEKCEPHLLRQRFRHLLPVQFPQFGFGIEQVDLADAPLHIKEDAGLGLGRERGWARAR